jgi:outer membrane immunogenic protein
MRKFVLPLVASLMVAAPALANEARVEARTGMVIDSGVSLATAGVAAGYDFDLANGVFAGAEVSADKILSTGFRTTFGFSGRIGATVLENNKLYVISGYSTKPCAGCENSIHLGTGIEHAFGKVYVKAEYRHYFARNNGGNLDAVATGLGVKF